MRFPRYCTIIALAGVCAASSAWAATLVEIKKGRHAQKILIEGDNARMESGQPGQYRLMKLKEKKMFVVNADRKIYIDVLSPPSAGGQKPLLPNMPAQPERQNAKVDAKLVEKGEGPAIAGYPTMHYQVTANGKVCSDEYVSAQALKIKDIANFVRASREIETAGKKWAGGAPPFMRVNPCMEADELTKEKLTSQGALMRSVLMNGRARHEVVSIKTNAPANPDAFGIPTGFKKTTPYELMQEAMRNPRRG
ncbi:MAG: hypothetical protein GY862_33345, partial [Gammaproteobacteria bacterium]|nr:hypothetical protein [Gammaproteobacteria bacterium]